MMARANKQQHKVPKCYLRAFADSSGRLWIASKNLKVHTAKPEHVLTERDYYTITLPAGGGSLVIETSVLGGIEGAYAELFRSVIQPQQPLDDTQRGVLAIFVASMMGRSPNRRAGLQRFVNQVESLTTQMRDAVEKMSDEERAELGRGPFGLTDADRDESVSAQEIIDAGKDVGSLHSSLIPGSIVGIAPLLYAMRWNFMVRSGDGESFITSDNPVAMVDPSRDPRSPFGVGLAHENVELSLPLSPDVALIISHLMNTDGHYLPVGPDVVAEINRRTMQQSETLVSNSASFLEEQVRRVHDKTRASDERPSTQ